MENKSVNASDNVKFTHPPRMHDGRHITNYEPNCQMNARLQQNLSSFQYKNFLMINAEKIMNDTNMFNSKVYGCSDCDQNVYELPKFKQDCTSAGCGIKVLNDSKTATGMY